jgi:bifunctional DNA-binding transcriptional regulator/antitoxin component of YhaV-PrlF toxin-antitoxin module
MVEDACVSTLTLTSKRQATFPVRLCKELNLNPGDVIEVEPAQLSGERVWVLRRQKSASRPWLGCLRNKTKVQDHCMAAVRASIAAGRGRNEG